MQRVFDWISGLFFFPFRRILIAVWVALTLFLLFVGSTFALPTAHSLPAEVSFPDLGNQAGLTVQNTDTIDSAYPLTPDESTEENGREGAEPPAGYVAPDESATTSGAAQTDCTLAAEFVPGTPAVNEVTLAPTKGFIGVWQIRNIGTCIWDNTYSVQAVQNNPIELVPIPVNIPSVSPGDEFEIRLSLVAPAPVGPHLGAWQLQAPSLELFGPLLSAQVLVVEGEENPTDAETSENETAVPLTDTQESESGTPSPLTDTQTVSDTVPVLTETPIETPTQLPTETPPATPTEIPATPTEFPTATPTELPSATPTLTSSATTAPIEVPTNTPTVVVTPTSTIDVASGGGDEGGITRFLASLPAPLQNPLVLALVVSIPILFVVLLILIWRLLRQSGPPAPPAPVPSNAPTNGPPSGGSTSFARPVSDASFDQSSAQDNKFKPKSPVTPQPVPIAQQVIDVPPQQTGLPSPMESATTPLIEPRPISAQSVEDAFAPWNSSPSSFAPRAATVTPVAPPSSTPASFRPAVDEPPSATTGRLPTEPMTPVWPSPPANARTFPTTPPLTGTPYLKSLGRPAGVIYFPLTKRIVKVGRGAENDLIIDESFLGWQTVSRDHAELERDGQDIFLFDLGTTNGVRINGQQTGSNLLQKDCTISFGQLQFAFRTNKE